jgi:ABC-type transport system involved in multi-copper enzyme maturation permease subunit
MTYAEQSKLTLDFMLAGTQFTMVLFSIFMGISLFQREITLGSVAMVLSKPISRATFILGKYLGQLAVQSLLILGMTLVTILLGLSLEAPPPMLPILQSGILTLLEVGIISAFTYLFAVNMGAITAALASGFLFLIGHYRDTFSDSAKETTTAYIWPVLRSAFPNLEVFNIKALVSYGIGLPWTQMGTAACYAIVCMAMFLALAVLSFERKDIFT